MSYRLTTTCIFILAFTGGFLTEGCGGSEPSPTSPPTTQLPTPPTPPPPPTVSRIEVTPNTASLEVGKTQRFVAIAKASDGAVISGATFSWTSSNTAIVTINAGGVATAVRAGTASIRAAAGGVPSSPVTINVSEPPPPEPVIATLTVSPSEATIEEGLTQQFVAMAVTSNGESVPDVEFTWASSDEMVATVDENGLAMGIGVGTATITAMTDGISGKAALTVTEPPPPIVHGLVITTAPVNPLGYTVGEIIGVRITFSEAVTISGSPLLKLGIGENVREAVWDIEASDGVMLIFRYVVTPEDRDEDGISIGSKALDVAGGSIRNGSGIDANLDIGDHAITNDYGHLVLGALQELACTDQRSMALSFSPFVVDEWDGTPFRVDIVRNFPDIVMEDYLLGELIAITRLADQIEAQLGYRIVEAGDLIDVPAGALRGWDQEFDRYWRNDLLPRDRGQILGFYLNDDNDAWGGTGSPMSSHLCCGTTSYNRRFFQPPHWTEWTGPNSPTGEAIVHELFHLLGFKHYYDQHELIGIQMSPGGLDRPWETKSPIYYATSTDIENLRCIFPKVE